MTVAEIATEVPDRERHRLAAFGLDVEWDWAVSAARTAAHAPRARAARTSVRLLEDEQFEACWATPSEQIFAPTYPDGRRRFSIDRAADHYRLRFDGFGRYLVGDDGTVVLCERTGTARDRQERFIFAQALPLAAALQGFELLHASAVCGRAGVAAFAGPSGAGKTSLASRLVVRGAGFVTDDVLALEPAAEQPLAHPGPGFMAVPNRDRALIGAGSGRLGRPVGISDKVHASPRPLEQPLPLRALFHLVAGSSFELAPVRKADVVRRVLASAFAPYLMTAERLRRHLEIARLLSSDVRHFELLVPPGGWAEEAILESVEACLQEVAV
jgi:hypothetical protein